MQVPLLGQTATTPERGWLKPPEQVECGRNNRGAGGNRTPSGHLVRATWVPTTCPANRVLGVRERPSSFCSQDSGLLTRGAPLVVQLPASRNRLGMWSTVYDLVQRHVGLQSTTNIRSDLIHQVTIDRDRSSAVEFPLAVSQWDRRPLRARRLASDALTSGYVSSGLPWYLRSITISLMCLGPVASRRTRRLRPNG